MKILVTGGAGFLGKHLCRRLTADGHEIKIVDLKPNPEFDTTITDVRDTETMKKVLHDVDAVFHLASLIEAGESVKYPKDFIESNIIGELSVLDAMVENNVNFFIFSSSAAIYGEPLQTPIKEDDRTLPINPYGMTKLAMEGLLSSYVETHGMTGVALRYFNLYGPEEHHSPETHAIPRFIEQIYNDQEVTVWGNGEHLRDYIHIQDVVDAHIKALQHAVSKPNAYYYFNLSTEKPASVIDIAKMIGSEMKKEPKITHFPPRPGDPLVLVANAQKAKEELGWTAQINLERGIKETVAYFLEFYNRK